MSKAFSDVLSNRFVSYFELLACFVDEQHDFRKQDHLYTLKIGNNTMNQDLLLLLILRNLSTHSTVNFFYINYY